MCSYGEHIQLVESKRCQISWCKECHGYFVIYNSCAMSFDKDQLHEFDLVLSELEGEDFHYHFLGKNHALVKNQFTTVGISLTQDQAEELRLRIKEAVALQEVFQVIYK